MTDMPCAKSAHNPCPVCGKPRGKGPHEFSHGKCMEIRAKTEGKEPAGLPGDFSRITKDQLKRSKTNHAAKMYKSGKLPKWMLDK